MSLPPEAEDPDVDPIRLGEADEPWEETVWLPKRNTKKAQKSWRARLRRREKIQRVADASAERWQRQEGLTAVPEPVVSEAPVLRPLPRPQGLGIPKREEGTQSALPPPRRELAFKAGVFKSSARLFVWVYGACLFAIPMLWDKLNRRDTKENGPRRLRETFEKMGTTFIK